MSREEAALYCAVHDGAPGDVAFYRDMARGAERVLELGAGDARVALELARAGLDTVALERDPGMLALARARRDAADEATRSRLTIVEGDMRTFSLEGRFDRIFVPFTGLYCLLSDEDLGACLERVRDHLTDAGLLVFDAYAADAFHRDARPEDYPDDRLEEVARLERDGEVWTVFERSAWDRDAQRMDATYVYVDGVGQTRAEIEVGHRYLLADQVEPALRRAGLEERARHGDFSGAPFGAMSGSMIVVAARA